MSLSANVFLDVLIFPTNKHHLDGTGDGFKSTDSSRWEQESLQDRVLIIPKSETGAIIGRLLAGNRERERIVQKISKNSHTEEVFLSWVWVLQAFLWVKITSTEIPVTICWV